MKLLVTAHGKGGGGDGYAPLSPDALDNLQRAERAGWKITGFTAAAGALDRFKLELVLDGSWRDAYERVYAQDLFGLDGVIDCEVLQ